jgi:type III pantothenate kinase
MSDLRLLIDAGNTRVKWKLVSGSNHLARSQGNLTDGELFNELHEYAPLLTRVAVSAVISEQARAHLESVVREFTSAPVEFYWAEAERNGLKNAYQVPGTMGADRWHGLYAAWSTGGGGVAIVDAGSAVTVDFLAADGQHRGGYIIPGSAMMLRSLRQDAARIGFQEYQGASPDPGKSTTECVHHGLGWLWQGMIQRLRADCRRSGLRRIILTGGDAPVLHSLGLDAELRPDLVFEGVAQVDAEDFP